ncbi:MAG: DUF4250 domain-containing protein [Muribaculaceae bacterium]|nr:DUF4250 domain-containing protein [Muribaculaceae bacterium]
MTLPQDPFMLLSMINMKLRDEYSSLDELCSANDLDKDTIIGALNKVGFEYVPDINQFR